MTASRVAAGATLLLALLLCRAGWSSEIQDRQQAAERATQLVGFPESAITLVDKRVVTDPMTPFWPVKDRSVWQVKFEGVTLTLPQGEGEPRTNPYITTWILWLDPESGAPVKLASPRPAAGGIGAMIKSDTKQLIGLPLGSSFIANSQMPGKPFSDLLAATPHLQDLAATATEIIAYYGLLTQRQGEETLIAGKPYWFIYYAGVRVPFTGSGPMVTFSGPPPTHDATYASEAMLVVDAATGAWYWRFLSEGGR